MSTWLLPLSIALPLLAAAGLLASRWQPAIHRWAHWSALPALVAALALPDGARLELPWLLLETQLGIDAIGRVFLFFTATLWLLATGYARDYLARDPRRTRFLAFFLVTMSGNLGLILAQDAASFFLFFTLMSFASYGLVVHDDTPAARHAGLVYIILVVIGEVLLLTGLLMLIQAAGTFMLADLRGIPPAPLPSGLLLLGFGIKAGVLPLHVWLPLAHPVAPTPASAVLSGAMIKAGLLGWLRFLPLGEAALPDWGGLCLTGGVAAAFYGVCIGLTQTNPKTVLAYSSISQMGWLSVLIGASLITPALWPSALPAILIYSLHHALAKGALFLSVGVAPQASRHPWMAAGLLLPALALAGLPLTSGAAAKDALKAILPELAAPWPSWLASVLPLATLGTTLLMARFLYLIWPRTEMASAPHPLWRPWAVLVLLGAGIPWLWPQTHGILRQTLSFTQLGAALWPLTLGTLVAVLAWWMGRRRDVAIALQIPAGDLLLPLEWLLRHGWQGWLRARIALSTILHPFAQSLTRLDKGRALYRHLQNAERTLRVWSAAGALFLLLIVTLLVLVMSAA